MKDITLNFGAIRDSVTRLYSMEILKESTHNTLKGFTNTVKKSPTLLKQHFVFKNFEECKPFEKERLAERFINQNLAILKGIKWQDVIRENRNLRITLLENSHVESDKGKNNELFNSIHTLIESVTNTAFVNIEQQQLAYEHLVEHLTRPTTSNEVFSKEKTDNPDLKNWEYITKIAVSNFNERYSHLNEDEKKTLSILLAEDSKKINYIEDLKNENIELIDKLLKETSDNDRKVMLEGFKTKLNNTKNISPFAADDFVISYFELGNTLKSM